VTNAGGVALQAGNRVVLQRVAGRDGWQIQAPTSGGGPAGAVNPAAVLPVPEGRATAVALCALLAAPRAEGWPPGVAAWHMDRADAQDIAASRGAFVYPHRYGHLRAGAYPADAATLAYWKLDEAAAVESGVDCSGNDRDLAVVSLGESCDSPFYRARAWNGVSSYGLRGNLPVENADRLSVELWIKPGSIAGDPVLVVQPGSFALEFAGGGTRLLFSVTTAGGTATAEATVTPAVLCDGAWHYVAGTYDGANVRLYLDGAAVGMAPAQTGAVSAGTSAALHVGAANPLGRYFGGLLQEIRVSAAGRTAGEIARAWAGLSAHVAVLTPAAFGTAVRTALFGALAALNGGTAEYALSTDGSAWTAIDPWAAHTAAASATWRVRVTLAGRAEVTGVGLVGL
jgi:hypothetical protein